MPNTLKQAVGRLIPYPIIHFGRQVIHFGPSRCVVCNSRHGKRIDTGYNYPILRELQVVGGQVRHADACPICHSGARERLVWFYLSRHGLAGGKRPLTAHFAPEKGLSARLSGHLGDRYAAYDLEPSRYRHLSDVRQANLEKLPFGDGEIDLLLCNHVLEHVWDLSSALAEVHRVLAPCGLALMQVPIALGLRETRDGGQSMSANERIRQFGQDDHVRLFSRDGYVTTLENSGFTVTPFRAREEQPELAEIWETDPLEELLLIRRRD